MGCRKMLRITENLENGDAVRVRLDGKISLDSYADLEGVLGRLRDRGRRIILLDMAGVTFLNGDAAQKLARARGENVRIVNCSPFISALLDTVASQP